MAVLTYAQLKAAASAALGDASTTIQSYLDSEQTNASVTQALTEQKAEIDADKAVIDAATEV